MVQKREYDTSAFVLVIFYRRREMNIKFVFSSGSVYASPISATNQGDLDWLQPVRIVDRINLNRIIDSIQCGGDVIAPDIVRWSMYAHDGDTYRS